MDPRPLRAAAVGDACVRRGEGARGGSEAARPCTEGRMLSCGAGERARLHVRACLRSGPRGYGATRHEPLHFKTD